MSKKVFITGIAGLIGSNLARALLRAGYEVIGVDSLIGGEEFHIPKSINLKWYNADILNLADMVKYSKGCEYIIHTAAIAAEGGSVFSPYLISSNIYSGTISVFTAGIINKTKKFINCSSMAMFGKSDGNLPFTEESPMIPEDPYGLAKKQALEQMSLLSDIHGLKYINIIPHNLIGKYQTYNDAYRNVMSIFINRLLQNKSIIIYGDGSQIRSFSHVNDVVNPIIQLMEQDFPNKSNWILGPDGNEISIRDLAYRVAHFCNIYPTVEYLSARPCEVHKAYCSSLKAITHLNYKPMTSVDDMIKEMVSYISSVGAKPFKYPFDLEITDDNRIPKTWKEKLF